jgi:hypothetical protein
MLEYKGIKKDVVIDGEKFRAFFPKGHSAVKGIIYKYKKYDNNAGDAWANRHDWVTELTLYVLWKGNKEWEKKCDGDNRLKDLKWDTNHMDTLDGCLFDLEAAPVKHRYSLSEEEEIILSNIKEEKERLSKIKKELKTYCPQFKKFDRR